MSFLVVGLAVALFLGALLGRDTRLKGWLGPTNDQLIGNILKCEKAHPLDLTNHELFANIEPNVKADPALRSCIVTEQAERLGPNTAYFVFDRCSRTARDLDEFNSCLLSSD